MAEKIRAQIKTDVTTVITANGAYGITPAQLHDILHDIADSFLQEADTAKDIEANSVDVDVEGYLVSSVKVVGAQEANIVDASEAHGLNAVFDDTEVEAALDALGVKINAVLGLLENHGLMAGAP